MSFDLFPFPASKLPSIWNAIAEASRKCHHHLSVDERLVTGLAALHHMVVQINERIMISVFTNQLTVQVPLLSNFCPVVVSLLMQVINLCPGVPTHSQLRSVTCHVYEWNPDLPMRNKPMAACAQMDEDEDGIIQGQVILSVLTQ